MKNSKYKRVQLSLSHFDKNHIKLSDDFYQYENRLGYYLVVDRDEFFDSITVVIDQPWGIGYPASKKEIEKFEMYKKLFKL